ncbi:MAG: hypothetical protein PHC62_06750 [Candidatus Izemoplasmatales bacterium]|nr:hypothetical protein [Candidatus Izemoplasmatales bacterium]
MMNRKNIVSMIKKSALKEMPDVLPNINLDHIDIIPEEKALKSYPWNLRKVFTLSFSFLFLGVISIFAYSVFTHDSTNYTPFQSESQLIAYQAVSAASLLSEIEAVPLSYEAVPLAYDATPYALDTTSVIEDEINIINQYLNMMEIVLGDTSSMITTNVESDDLAYEYEIIYRNVDLVGNLIEFKLYYNLIDTGTETLLSGVLYHDLESYVIEGTISNESGEFTSLTAYLDDNHLVNVENISTNSSQKFKYRVYAFSALQNEGNVSLSLNDEVLQAKIEVLGNTCNYELNVERVKQNNGSKFQVGYSINSGAVTGNGDFEVEVAYDQAMGMYRYNYIVTSNGNKQEFSCGRGYKGNRQADTDDFTNVTPSTNSGMGHH